MKSTSSIFFLIAVLCINNTVFSNTNTEIETSINIGQEYYGNNCHSEVLTTFSDDCFSLSKAKNYSTWHAFRIPDDGTTIELCFNSINLGNQSSIAVYDANRTTIIWTTDEVLLDKNISTKIKDLDPDSQYFIRIASTEESKGEYTLQVNLMPPPIPPPNDLCTGATDFGLLECEFWTTTPFDPGATPDQEATGNCVDDTEPGQWYTFTTPDPLPYGSIGLGSFIDIEIFTTTSDCSDLVYETCSDGSSFYFEPTPATTYYLLTNEGLWMNTLSNGFAATSCMDPAETMIFWAQSFGIPFNITGLPTNCAQPSNAVLCENNHVAWFTFITGCGTADVSIEVTENVTNLGADADEISISAFSNDCTTLLADYDPNGLGYVCSGIVNAEALILEDLPPNTEILIAFGSGTSDAGFFDIHFDEVNASGEIENDICNDAEEVFEGLNEGLTNLCANNSGLPTDIIVCESQSEATVWYEYDPGDEPVDITVNIISDGINSPVIASYANCVDTELDSNCSTTIEMTCINFPIMILVGSSEADAGKFNLEIISNPSSSVITPDVSGDDICSNQEAAIDIEIPGGEIVTIDVGIAPGSSSSITGMTNQSFVGVSGANINDVLVNDAATPEEAIYTITVSSNDTDCPASTIEFAILVFPEFNITSLSIDECLPHLLELNVNDIISGGSPPYTTTEWYWNSTNLLSTIDELTLDLTESGELLLEVIDSEDCTVSVSIPVNVSEPITPTFDFPLEYCQTSEEIIVFPETSIEGIQGSWNLPSIDLTQITETGYYDIIFTPNPDDCSLQIMVSVLINIGQEPEFDLPDEICSGEGQIVFPTSDLNGIQGTWNIPSLDVSNLSGMQSNTFYPNTQECISIFEYIYVVQDEIELTFEQPDEMCSNDEAFILSNFSEEGYEGTWDISVIDPNLVSGNTFTGIWTPLPNQSSCIGSSTITVEITEPLVPEFNLPIELCSLDGSYTFPTEDIQSLGGTWSVPNFIPGDITGSIESVFTSNDFCVETYTWEIEIVEPLIPEFDLDLEHCALDDIYTLPLISDNGIPGSWTQASIDPSMTAGQQIMVEFQSDPTEFCVESIEVVIEVTEAQDPVFDLPTLLCWTDENLLLPSASTNAIEGIWTPALIDVASNPGAMLSSTFTPTDGSCSNEETETFEILSPYEVDPIATDPSDCSIEDGSIMMDIIQGNNLEFSIDGGMTWQSSTLFSSLGSGGFTIMIQSTEIPDCGLSVESFLSSPDGPVINEVMSSNINSCTVENGSIIIDATGNNLEYSIDDGLTWQSSNEFDNLSEGDYVINIREEMSDCVVDVGAAIMDFPQTEILDVNTEDLTDCNLDDGQIEIIAVGEALEYSIDNGASWSSQNIFNNLPSGEFNILVQSTLGVDCLASDVVNITAPSMPIIINSDTENPTQCVPTTGRIEVEAEGSNLEYSIDGGLTWQSSNIFSDLVSEEYQLIVRDSERINCFVDEVVSIILEDETLPESSIMISAPSECDFSDARLEVANVTAGVEYSIDGGMSWQTDNIFDNLTAGTYELITRKISLPECLVIQEIVIPNSACPCNILQLDFRVSNITCTGDDFALVELTSIQGMNDANIDILWQNGETNLSIEVAEDGWQIVTIAYDDDCIWIDSVWVELVKPIEFELNVEDLDCPEVNNGLLEVLNVVGGSGAYEYSIDGVEYQSESIFTDLGADVYQVYVRDETNCLTIEETEILVNDDIEIVLPEIETIHLGESVILVPNIDASRIDDFNWTPEEGIENPNDLVITVSPKETTTYTLEIFYGECTDKKEVIVGIKLEEEVHIGNVFSPNGDNSSDVIYIQGVPNSTIELDNFSIFDRWGNKIFDVSQPEFNNKEDGWDGYFNGAKVISGVYVFVVNYSQDGLPKVKVGSVTLVY